MRLTSLLFHRHFEQRPPQETGIISVPLRSLRKVLIRYSHCPSRITSTFADTLKQRGLVVKANVPDALDEVVDWRPVFIDIEGGKFSTWRGIPSNPDKYVVIGDIFVTGIEKPSLKQTEGIRAIRKDLIEQVEPHHLVFKKVIPFAVLTLWNVFATIPLLIPTGAFVSAQGETADSKIGVIPFNPNVQELTGEGESTEVE